MKLDVMVLSLRFLVRFLLGSMLFGFLFFVVPLKILGLIPFLVGLLAVIWGGSIHCDYSGATRGLTGLLMEGMNAHFCNPIAYPLSSLPADVHYLFAFFVPPGQACARQLRKRLFAGCQ